MKRITIPCLTTLLVATLGIARSAEVEGLRTWTSSGGKSLKAALVKVTKVDKVAKATMKRQSGQEFVVPLSGLSDADQEAIQAWLKTNPTGVAIPIPPFIWPTKYNGSATPKVVEAGYDDEEGYHLYRTKYFDFQVDAKVGKTTISQCVAVFESIVGALDTLPLALDTVPASDKERYKAILVSSRTKYAELGGMPNSGGFFWPSKNLTVIPFRSLGIEKKGNSWGFDGKNRNFDTLVHELTHHSMGRKWSSLPVWVTEGIADYMAAMPYRSGQFLFTNVGKSAAGSVRDSYKGTTWERSAMPKGVFIMVKPSTLFAISHREWSKTLAMNAMDGSRYYSSSLLMIYYFMHEDAGGRGEHFVPWLHEIRAARLTERGGVGEKQKAITEKYLMRGRTNEELEKDIAATLQKKGLRVQFGKARTRL